MKTLLLCGNSKKNIRRAVPPLNEDKNFVFDIMGLLQEYDVTVYVI